MSHNLQNNEGKEETGGNGSVPKSELHPMLEILSQTVEKSTSAAAAKKSKKSTNKIWWGSRPNPETGLKRTKSKPRVRSKRKVPDNLMMERGEIEVLNAPVEESHVNETRSNLYKELQDEIECLKTQSMISARNLKWHERTQAETENWDIARGIIFENMIETEEVPEDMIECHLESCTKQASICCISCNNCYMCSDCDTGQHCMMPLHDRNSWMHGYFEKLAPNETVVCNEEGTFTLSKKDCYFPCSKPSMCEHCRSTNGNFDLCKSGCYILISTKGRFDVERLLPVCSECGTTNNGWELKNILLHRFWPGNPIRISHLVEIDLLHIIDKVTLHLPGSSISGIAAAIQDISALNGMDLPISHTMLANALAEFRFSQTELKKLMGADNMKCPPCSISQHSCHMDGNFKLYRYSKVPRGIRTPYYQDVFVAKNDDVSKHDNIIGKAKQRKTKADGNLCGSSYWKAARGGNFRGRGSLDETGLLVAGCRHALASKAVNMFTGERFSYHHYLHVTHVLPRKVEFMWQDVICKYWPWAVKLAEQDEKFKPAIQTVKPALSVMHAKAHALECQIVWSGENQSGAGRTTGEDMEQFFSHLSRVGSTTKNMSASRREDVLTEHVLFWNERKIKKMPELLVKKYNRVKIQQKQYGDELLTMSLHTPSATSEHSKWREQIVSRAKCKGLQQDERDNELTHAPTAKALFKLHVQIRESEALQAYENITTEDRILFDIVMKPEHPNQDASDLETLRSNYNMMLETLLVHGNTEYVLLDKGRKDVCTEKVMEFDRRIAELVMSIKQRTHAISALADTSKQRTKLRSRNDKEKRLLREIVEKKNELNHTFDIGLPDVSVEGLVSGSTPIYTDEGVSHDTQEAFCDLYEKVARLNEEEQLLVKEMRNLILFYKGVLHAITKEQNGVPYSHSCQDISKQNCSHYCIKQFPVRKECNNGLCAVKKKGMSLIKQRLQEGVTAFSQVLTQSEIPYHTSSEEDSSDDSDINDCV